MPDRELRIEELVALRQEDKSLKINAMAILYEEGGKPSLYDLCLLELMGRLDAQTNIIIGLGREIERLKLKLEEAVR